jgi:hypothetical protein
MVIYLEFCVRAIMLDRSNIGKGMLHNSTQTSQSNS